MGALRLQLRPAARVALAILNVLPPGLGAMLAGYRNPHTRLLRNGALQLLLVLAGFPWIVPAAVGLAWAVVDAVRIWQAEMLPLPPKDDAGESPVGAKGRRKSPP